jgi:hypothetical protein
LLAIFVIYLSLGKHPAQAILLFLKAGVLSKCCAFPGINCVGSPQGASPPCLPALFQKAFANLMLALIFPKQAF